MLKILSSFKLYTSFKSLKAFSTGNLYTWGSIPAGTGFSDLSSDPVIHKPRRLAQFSSNVSKVAMGEWHSAIITQEGQLFTCGYGQSGCLGHDSADNIGAPEVVEFFNNKKVIDVACDGSHTVALTDDGAVWRWGTIDLSLSAYIYNVIGDKNENVVDGTCVPQKVMDLEGKKVVSLIAGKNFVSVFTDKGVFNWGQGNFGNFGDGTGRSYIQPTENHFLKEFLEHNHLKIIKAKASGFSTVMQLSNGKLYAMGENYNGQLGIRKNVGIILDEIVQEPTPIVEEEGALKGRKIVDFDLGGNSLLILTDDNKVFFSGLRLICKPLIWRLPNNVKIKKLLASYETFGVLSTENKVYAFNENLLQDAEYDYYTRAFEVESDIFDKGEVLDVGGRYNIHYAIVKN